MGVAFGVVAAICWGLGDFLITLLTRRIGSWRALIAIQVLSLLAWAAFLVIWPSRATAGPLLMGMVVATATCHVLGLVFVYRAFEIGTLSIVSPISAGFAVVTAILSLAAGEHPPALALAGAGLLIVGTMLATRSVSASTASQSVWRGVPEAILSSLSFGTMFWLFYFFVQPRLGYAWPLLSLKLAAVSSSVAIFLASRRRVSHVKPGAEPILPVAGGSTTRRTASLVILLALGAAAADTLAWLAYIRGTGTSYATTVTALASLFSVVTVLLAWRFFKERLAVHQWMGIAAILLGIFIVST